MSIDCTGVAAFWCPVHGDCSCPDILDRNDPGCPLHATDSTHAEPGWIRPENPYARDPDAEHMPAILAEMYRRPPAGIRPRPAPRPRNTEER